MICPMYRAYLLVNCVLTVNMASSLPLRCNQFFQIPNMVAQATLHCGCHSQATVYTTEIVVREVKRQCGP